LGIRAVFFDLGGTLLVLRRDRIFRSVLQEIGREAGLDRIHGTYMSLEPWWLTTYSNRVLSPRQMEEAYRDLDEKVFSKLFPGVGPSEAFQVSKLVRKRWPDLEDKVPLELYPDVAPTLAKLAQTGYSLGLISNAPADTDRVVASLGLERFLGVVVISGAVGYSKPNPEIFRIALREARVRPSEAIHIGDVYEADVVGARNAGMQGILLDRDDAQSGLDCPRIRSLDEVFRYLGRPQGAGL
jgi:HAD superfamily hydrolase (TIGR01509 family)